jgi:parallel beta-helix repeat protein
MVDVGDEERGVSQPAEEPRPLRRARRQADRARRKGARKLLAAGAAAAGVAAIVAPADAATFTVTNTSDGPVANPGDLPGSLRQAIFDANAAAGPDVIDFNLPLPDGIVLTDGQLSITDSVDIQGPGATLLAVSGNGGSRVFYLYSNIALLDVSISGLTITGGDASAGGGIIDYNENLVLTNVTITGNTVTGDGGGIWCDGFNGTLAVIDSVISGNSATGGGGGGIFVVDTGGPLLIQNSRIVNNVAAGSGGGIYFYDPDDDVTIVDSTIAGNIASGAGGGIYLYDTDGGTFTVSRTTISGNQASAGGAIFLYAPDNPVVIENSTISGNEATAGSGGGIYLYSFCGDCGGSVTIRHTTIASNSASGGGGGVYFQGYMYSVTLDHTIVGDNSAPVDPDLCGAGEYDVRFSLVESPGAANINDNGGNVFNQDPQLAALANNGGPTETHLPAFSSPAINAGDPAFVSPPSTDQRGAGFPRVLGGRIDIGAVERAVAAAGTLQFNVSNYSQTENGVTATITVTRTGGADGAVSIDFATSNGSATQPADYGTAAGTLNWADQDVAPKTFQVTIVDDLAVEGNETVNLTLANPQGGAALGSPSAAVLTIIDNDSSFVPLEVPTLDEWGLILLAGLLGAGGLVAMRRQRDLAGPIALALTLGAAATVAEAIPHAHGSHGAKRPAGHRGKQEAVRIEQKSAGFLARLPDGTTVDLAKIEVKIRDQRRPRAGRARALPKDLGALLAEPGAHVFVRPARRSKPARVVVVVGEPKPEHQPGVEKPRD